jgi:hypothetical protein
MLWSAIIAAAQLLDATKHIFPFARLHKAASEMTVALDLLYINAEAEWAEIEAANMPDTDITSRRKRLARLRVEIEHEHFPDGFTPSDTMYQKARRDADAYLEATYGQGLGPPAPERPKYKLEVADGVFVDSIFPDFEFDMPMPLRGRFAPQPANRAAAEADHPPA